jgi:hypothetical protein
MERERDILTAQNFKIFRGGKKCRWGDRQTPIIRKKKGLLVRNRS